MKKPDPYMTDEENPELTTEQIARMRPAAEVLGQAFVDAQMRGRGRPKAERTKTRVTLRLDPDVLAHFRATGPGWSSRINETLRRELRRKA